jgi:Glycosyl hydrolase family 59
MIAGLLGMGSLAIGPRVAALAAVLALAAVPAARASTTPLTSIRVDGHAAGGTFGGVGALSAGGGNSRLLIDYPPASRNAILDYLFRPNYGAAVQLLKVEIGGDVNSTDGAEASIEHTRGHVDCNAGYEFWLAKEARARNPAIKLFAMAWGTPGWTGSFFTHRTIAYIVNWLKCARRQGIAIDYLGGNQNEQERYVKSWTEALRRALDAAGFSRVRLVMAEVWDIHHRWAVASDLARDSAFRSAVSVVGDHDICGHVTNGYRCFSTPTARSLGMPLWATELGGMDGNRGAAAMARSMIRGYPQARLSAFLSWPLVSATPPGVPFNLSGLVSARQPWSGNYTVNAMTYTLAMVSWFTAPGWHYVDRASGALRGNYANGGYSTLVAPNGKDWTTLAETTSTKASQVVRIAVSGGLASDAVHVWRTNPSSRNATDWMVHEADVRPLKGAFRYTLQPGYMYTFSTVERSAKGAAVAPPPRALGAYVEQPSANPLDETPMYLSPMDGAFEHQPCRDNAKLVCTQQMDDQPPVYWWRYLGFPYAVIGDGLVRDYTVSSDVLFTSAGASAGVIARFAHRQRHANAFHGYLLTLSDSGRWELLKNHATAAVDVLKSGTLKRRPGLNRWHNVSLTVAGSTLTAAIDGKRVASVADKSYATGIAGIEAGAVHAHGKWTGTSWPVVQYRRLRFSP